jgi:hypothetical protein
VIAARAEGAEITCAIHCVACGMEGDLCGQTQRIYENVTLLALDLLARIIAMRIDPGPPSHDFAQFIRHVHGFADRHQRRRIGRADLAEETPLMAA